MPQNIWENHFGIRVDKEKCPISRCGNSMKKSSYCDGKNHKQEGSWEINKRPVTRTKAVGIEQNKLNAKHKPVCCHCNHISKENKKHLEKSATKVSSKKQKINDHPTKEKISSKRKPSVEKELVRRYEQVQQVNHPQFNMPQNNNTSFSQFDNKKVNQQYNKNKNSKNQNDNT